MVESPPRDRIDPDLVIAELERVLQSGCFARSERSRELLRYLVQQDLAGNADRLKGFTIALDVFGRDSGFDPSTDAVVRVQAGRLREMLSSYYAKEGVDDAVRISVPRGSYVPAYRLRRTKRSEGAVAGAPAGTGDPDTPAASQAPETRIHNLGDGESGGQPRVADVNPIVVNNIRRFWFALSVIALMLAVVIALLVQTYVVSEDGGRNAGGAANGQEIASRPFGRLPTIRFVATGQSNAEQVIERILEDALPRFGNIDLMSGSQSGRDAGAPVADFLLKLVTEPQGQASLQLVHRETDIIVSTEPIRLADEVVGNRLQLSEILSRLISPGGALFAFLEREKLLNPLTECMVRTEEYSRHQDEARHAAAVQCNEGLIADGISVSPVYANAAILEAVAVSQGYALPPESSFDDALRLARRAIELSPASAYGYRALHQVLSEAGEGDAALDAAERASELNPYDLEIAASYGESLMKAGEYGKAADILQRTTEACPSHPARWDYTLFVAAYMDGREDVAARAVNNLVGRNKVDYQAARLIAADMRNRPDRMASLASKLALGSAMFSRDPLAFYMKSLPPDAARKLVAGLKHAGLEGHVQSAK